MKRIILMMLILMPFASAVGDDVTGEFTKKVFNKSAYMDMDKSSYCGEEGIMKDKSMFYKHMGGKTMMYKSSGILGFGLIKLVCFAVIAFVFSLIFWATHNWLVKKK